MVAGLDDELLIRNALTIGTSTPVDIRLKDGLIAEIGSIGGEGLDAGGRLVVPGFVNIHTHLDKADLLSEMRPEQFGKSLEENRQLLKSFKGDYTVDGIMQRAKAVLSEFTANGVTAVRTQVDVDGTGGLKPLEALTGLREETGFLQVCAFPQEGVLDEGGRAVIEQALDSGADILGGLPLVEKTREEQVAHIDVLFELARKYDVDLEVQVDESNNPEDFLLPVLADRTIQYGRQGRVSATHCISLSAVDDETAAETIGKVRQAKLNVIVTPSANLITQFKLPAGVKCRASNSVTRVVELLDAGVNVALGTDNVRDVFYPLGNGSILREMHVLASAARLTGAGDAGRLFDMASVNGARIMGLNYGLAVGCRADLIVLNAGDCLGALNAAPIVPYVIRGGRVVCESNLEVKHG